MSKSVVEMNHTYVLAIQHALFSFQMIEEVLKIGVRRSYEIIKLSSPFPVVFNFEPSAIENAPLSKLIKLFANVSSNRELIADLKKIESWRNFCAHRGYAHEFLSRQSAEPVSEKDIEEVRTVADFAVKLVARLGDDLRTLQETYKALKSA